MFQVTQKSKHGGYTLRISSCKVAALELEIAAHWVSETLVKVNFILLSSSTALGA